MCFAFAGTAGLPGVALAKLGVPPNAAYYLQPGHVEGSLEATMCFAFARTAGVPPAAAKQIKESKSQSKQADARTCNTTGEREVLCFSIFRLGLC
jgi:hypothetical protein